MDTPSDNSVCILCSKISPLGTSSSSNEKEVVRKFVQQTGMTSTLSFELVRIPRKTRQFCNGCLSTLTSATERREQAERLEVQVRRLQTEIVGMLQDLKGLMTCYAEEISLIENKIKLSDETSCLKKQLTGKRKRSNRDEWAKEHVFQFRQEIIKVATDLTRWREDLSSKVITNSSEGKAVNSLDSVVEPKTEINNDILNEPFIESLDNDTFMDFDYSPALQSEEELNKDDSDDEDYILPNLIPSSEGLTPQISAELPIPKPPSCQSRKSPRKIKVECEEDEDSSQLFVSNNKSTPPKNNICKKLDLTKTKEIRDNLSWYSQQKGRSAEAQRFSCTTCTFSTTSITKFEQHLREHEADCPPETKTIACALCPDKFSNQQHHEFHMCFHQGVFRTTCDSCGHRSINTFEIKNHILKTHPGLTLFECANCSRVHSNMHRYMLHFQKHYGDNLVIPCGLCPQIFKKRLDLHRHYCEQHKQQLDIAMGQSSDTKKLGRQRQVPSWCVIRGKTAAHRREMKQTFFCKVCNNFSTNHLTRIEQHLRGHERELSDDEKTLKCPECPSLSFGNEQLLELHQCYHDSIFKMACDQCRLVQNILTLPKHLKDKHGIQKTWACGSCSMVNSSRDAYLRHLGLGHSGNDNAIMICDLCPETFGSRQKLIQHLEQAHDQFIQENEIIAKRREKSYARMRKVIESGSNALPCDECGKIFKTLNRLNCHKMHVHSDERRYKCSVCDKSFKSSGNLSSHMQIHARDPSGATFQCHLCTKSFNRSYSLQLHMRLHDGTGFTCEQCGHIFSGQSSLKNHLKMHEENDKIEWINCSKCSCQFTDQAKLDRHMKRAHRPGNRWIEPRCTHCNKVFHSQHQLRDHVISVHENAKPYVCGECQASFGMESNLRGHIRKIHPVEWDTIYKTREWRKNTTPATSDNQNDPLKNDNAEEVPVLEK